MLTSMIQEEKERKENKQQQQKPDAVEVRGPKTLRSRAPKGTPSELSQKGRQRVQMRGWSWPLRAPVSSTSEGREEGGSLRREKTSASGVPSAGKSSHPSHRRGLWGPGSRCSQTQVSRAHCSCLCPLAGWLGLSGPSN